MLFSIILEDTPIKQAIHAQKLD